MTIESGVVELEEQATTEQYGTTTDDDCPAETSSSDDAAGTATATENSDSDDDDDDHTVIVLEQGMDNEHQAPSVGRTRTRQKWKRGVAMSFSESCNECNVRVSFIS